MFTCGMLLTVSTDGSIERSFSISLLKETYKVHLFLLTPSVSLSPFHLCPPSPFLLAREIRNDSHLIGGNDYFVFQLNCLNVIAYTTLEHYYASRRDYEKLRNDYRARIRTLRTLLRRCLIIAKTKH